MPMELMEVDRCCCGCSLRTGSVIIAVIGILQDCLTLGLFTALIVQSEETDYYKISGYVGITVSGIHCVACILLLIGALARVRPCLLPYLVVQAVFVTFGVLGIVMQVVSLFRSGGAAGAAGIGVLVVHTGLAFYQYVVVLSFFRQLAEGKSQNERRPSQHALTQVRPFHGPVE